MLWTFRVDELTVYGINNFCFVVLHSLFRYYYYISHTSEWRWVKVLLKSSLPGLHLHVFQSDWSWPHLPAGWSRQTDVWPGLGRRAGAPEHFAYHHLKQGSSRMLADLISHLIEMFSVSMQKVMQIRRGSRMLSIFTPWSILFIV